MSRVRRTIAWTLMAVPLLACSVFLDFDLTGGTAGAIDTGAVDAGDGPADVGSPTEEAATPKPVRPCPDAALLCDSFEDRTEPIGGPFQLSKAATLATIATFATDPRFVFTGQHALQIAPTFDSNDGPLIAAQNVSLLSRKAIELRFALWLEYDPLKFDGERTLVMITPAASYDVTDGGLFRLVADAKGLAVVASRFDGVEPTYRITLANHVPAEVDPTVTDGWHFISLWVKFGSAGNGRLTASIDGFGYDTKDHGGASTSNANDAAVFSVALAATGTRAPFVARFDDVSVVNRE